ncbi:hypothetical protein C8J56DRAFT_1164776 [Mycena floridula]|nr:hypothetical protein C8J56DRAFT_1164776 [Mycena floridula]
MFASGSPYSPFFTSGLLLSSSPAAMSSLHKRGSLPTIKSASTGSVDRSSSFYFDAAGRDPTQFRSFLSLDLAESQSLRSFSTRRPSLSTRRIDVDCSLATPIATRTASERNPRPSRGSIPSAKPVPLTLLPEIPQKSLPTSPRSQGLDDHLRLIQPRASPMIQRRSTARSWTTVSTGYRKTKRSDALAQLEGRVKPPVLTIPKNFMCMSDDEGDDGEDSDSDSDSFFQDSDSVDLPVFADRHLTMAFAAPSDRDSEVLPSPVTLVHRLPLTPVDVESKSQSSSKSPSKARPWLPLTSFIELQDQEDGRWGYRSFIQISIA